MVGLRFAQTSAVRKARKHSKLNKTLKVNKGATKISKTNLSRQDLSNLKLNLTKRIFNRSTV